MAGPISNLPDWAESRFAMLCAEQGVVCNPSVRDRTGWDFIVEFDRPPVPGLAHDQQPGGATARVQIKSKTGGTTSTELKLSNALRFCREPDPCFVVLMHRSRDGTGMRCYAREFDEDLMREALRRAREADRDGLKDLNRIRMPVRFSPADAHDDDLLSWIQARSLAPGADYATKKAQLNSSLGFEEASHLITATFATTEIQALIDNAVGLRPDCKVEKLVVRSQRFDIPAREPMFEGQPTSFSMSVKPRPARVIVRGGEREAIFTGEFRAFRMDGFSRNHDRATFSSDALQGVIRGAGRFDLNWSFDGSAELPLATLRNQLDFQLALRTPLEVTLEIEGAEVFTSEPIEIPSSPDPWVAWLDGVLDQLARLTRASERPTLSLDELSLRHEEVTRFVETVADGDLTIKTTLIGDWSAAGPAKSLCYFVLLHAGDTTFTAIVRRPCISEARVGDILELVFADPVVLEHAARRGGAAAHLPALRRRFEAWRKRLGSGTVVVNDGNLAAIGGAGVEIEEGDV